VVENYLGFSCSNYSEFPDLYLIKVGISIVARIAGDQKEHDL